MNEREALKLALEALEQWNTPLYKRGTAITAIKEVLAQPEQEPVANMATALLDAKQMCDQLDSFFRQTNDSQSRSLSEKSMAGTVSELVSHCADSMLLNQICLSVHYSTPPHHSAHGLG